jgi:hypothetical protein
MLTAPPRQLLAANQTVGRFGMYDGPIEDVDLIDAQIPGRPGVLGRLRLKRWQHMCIVHPEAVLTFAVVDAGFLRLGWARFIDRKTGESFEHGCKSPFLDMAIARSLMDDRTSLRTRGLTIDIHNELNASQHLVQVEASGGAPSIGAALTVHADWTPLVVNLPLGRGRSMYSHKAVLPVSGSFEAGGRRYDCDRESAYAILDIHKAHYPRRTFWNWATLVGRSGGRTIGLNLTRNVVVDDSFHENGVWVDGELSLLSTARFDFSHEDRWRVGTADGSVDLVFQAQGERREDLNLGLIVSRFRQRFGTFTGHVGKHVLDSAYGLMEDHTSVW